MSVEDTRDLPRPHLRYSGPRGVLLMQKVCRCAIDAAHDEAGALVPLDDFGRPTAAWRLGGPSPAAPPSNTVVVARIIREHAPRWTRTVNGCGLPSPDSERWGCSCGAALRRNALDWPDHVAGIVADVLALTS